MVAGKVSQYFYLVGRRRAAAQSLVTKPEPQRVLASGQIARLLIGQAHGFIRLADRREVYFHRADMGQGRSFNSLRVGDSVTFELFDDRVSGARALQVRRPYSSLVLVVRDDCAGRRLVSIA